MKFIVVIIILNFLMECKLCNTICIIPTGAFAASSQNILIETADGTPICSACSDAQDFASSVVKPVKTPGAILSGEIINSNKKVETKQIKTPQIKSENKVCIKCNKCNKTFSGPTCNCGFRNPLYKRK